MTRSKFRDYVTITCCAVLLAFILWAVSTVHTDGAQGTASWMPERFGAHYLALPEGPGHTVVICGARCLTMTSTDAGPSKAMQRKGRIADIAVRKWEYICALPRSSGLCPVTVTYGGAARPAVLPSTDTVVPTMRPWKFVS
jgi:hypothetical protein